MTGNDKPIARTCVRFLVCRWRVHLGEN